MSCGVFRLFGPVFMRRGATYNASSTSGQSPSTLRCPPFQTFFSFLFGFPPFSCSFFLCVFVPRCFFLFPSSLFFFFFFVREYWYVCLFFFPSHFFSLLLKRLLSPLWLPPVCVCVCFFFFFALFCGAHAKRPSHTVHRTARCIFLSLSAFPSGCASLSSRSLLFFFFVLHFAILHA